jgi:hypothetical protein
VGDDPLLIPHNRRSGALPDDSALAEAVAPLWKARYEKGVRRMAQRMKTSGAQPER